MTHPGIATLVMIGIGFAALYYYFRNSEYNDLSAQGYHQGRSSSRQQRNGYNNRSWSPPPPNPSRRRRNDPTCTICIEGWANGNKVRLQPCMHEFHKQCIDDWQNRGTGDARQLCPICRHKIHATDDIYN